MLTNESCNTQCLTCSVTDSQCDICASGKHRIPNPPECACEPGYHDNGSKTKDCEKCVPACLTCAAKEDCIICKNELFRKLNVHTGNCECIRGYKEVGGFLAC